MGSAISGVRAMASARQKQAQKKHPEIADSSPDLLQKMLKIVSKRRSSKNTIQSDFVKHSQKFGGSGFDFGRHLEGAFGAENAREAMLEAGF